MSKLLSLALPGECRHVVSATSAWRGLARDQFGGARICAAAAVAPTSYCATHKALYYVPTGEITRLPNDLSRRLAQPQPDREPELTEIFEQERAA